MSKLANIIRLRKWELDEKRRRLADLQGEREEIVLAIETMEAEVVEQSRNSGLEVSAVAIGAYLEGVRMRQQQLSELLAAKEREVAKHQDIVAEGFRELKTFEIAQSREKAREAAAEAKMEQDAFDELGIQNHAREEALADPRYVNMRRN
ncbi:flagellar FliJ family protein [Kordiimonas lipolytica]|uniref:Flagellar FliJ family protein n=1 Tax=Kordiimonas lipolytica TaxID=1662421 RepID=A0ABV8UB65_9PROT|nr:flagellar FliJ family protein [Kordiimonas lipolytica]